MSATDTDRATSTKGLDLVVLTLATGAVFAGTLVCTNSSGEVVDGSDATGLRFVGVADEGRATTDGDTSVRVARVGAFRFAASGMSAGDIGKPVFLKDNQTVALSSGVTYRIYVGTIHSVVSATSVWVQLDVGGDATAVGGIVDLDGGADALILDADGDTTISSPTDDQIDIEINGADDFRFTANTFQVLAGSSMTFADNARIKFGDADDFTLGWNATFADLLPAADDSMLKLGNGTLSWDVWIYGNTASDYLLWDASAGLLSCQGAAALGVVNKSIGASTAAAGSTNADAAALPAGTAPVYPTTAADGTKGVIINVADKVTGRQIMVGNGVPAVLKVYPPSGGTINGAAANAAHSSTSGKGVILICLDATANTWLAF